MPARARFSVNGRTYPFPAVPAVVVCLDGCEPEYLERAIAAGAMPAVKRMMADGTFALARSAIPSFTNPNNLSIATGSPPAVHGISGNFFLDPDSGEEVMMNDARFLRAPTIFAAAQEAGLKVAVVTAKDKLRALLGAGLDCAAGQAWCFSAECSGTTTRSANGVADAAAWVGLPVPDVYSADLSEFVLAAGMKLLREHSPDFMYLSTTDYVQHKFAPGDGEAIAFCAMVDRHLHGLDSAGAVLVATADHGMKPKHGRDGTPNVIYLQDILDDWLGASGARVILPITDPYVVHHGSLGSFATIHFPPATDVSGTVRRLASLSGVDVAISGDEAARRFELPRDRIGGAVVISGENTVLGTSRDRHQLDALDAPLRSHGGLSEQSVPFIVNRRVGLDQAGLRNFDAFQIAAEAAQTGGEHGQD